MDMESRAGAITRNARRRTRQGPHGHFQRNLQLVGGQHLVEPHLHLFRGRLVGTDDAGNRYYVQSRGVGPLGRAAPLGHLQDLAEASYSPSGVGMAGCSTPSTRRRWRRIMRRARGKCRIA